MKYDKAIYAQHLAVIEAMRLDVTKRLSPKGKYSKHYPEPIIYDAGGRVTPPLSEEEAESRELAVETCADLSKGTVTLRRYGSGSLEREHVRLQARNVPHEYLPRGPLFEGDVTRNGSTLTLNIDDALTHLSPLVTRYRAELFGPSKHGKGWEVG